MSVCDGRAAAAVPLMLMLLLAYVIRDQRDLTIDEWMDQVFAVELFIAGVVRMDRHRRIAEHGLWTGSCNDDLLVRALQLVGERPDDAKDVGAVLRVAGHRNARACLDVDVIHLKQGG